VLPVLRSFSSLPPETYSGRRCGCAPIPSGAEDIRNVHDATRLGWRRRLAEDHPASFRVLSARAAAFFEQDASPAGRIEWIYHLLSADPERGANALQNLVEAEPNNTSWRRDLAVAHGKMGDILKAQGDLEAAQTAYGEYLGISRRLAEADPSDEGWQRDLAVAHSRVGNIFKARQA
jgi:Flp pilus assembly protein TadD